MASSSYEEVRKDLYTQIHDKLERRDTIDRRFARIGTAEAVLGPSNLRRLFCSIVPLGDSLEKLFGESITADVLASRAEERGLHNFLATLIYAGCSIESARGFIATLLIRPASDGWPIYYEGHNRIDKLPAGTEQLKQIFGTDNELDVIRFRDTQPCFCPIVLYKGEDVRITDGEKQRLPYMSDEVYIDRGSYGMVYRVVIAKGHLANRHSSMANTEPVTMARKDFKKIHDFQKEYEVIKHILCADRKSKNIVETFGSLQLDQTTFSLFMAYAECDLREWMRRTEPPVLESGKSDILKSASGLADGLKFLHSDIRDPNGNRMVCYHMDLKPANILVFPDTEQGKMLWKISDFGMSRIKVSHHHTVTSDRDISAVFEKRAEDTSVSHTVNRRFEGSYLAPESDISVRKMNEKSDIWSLGCVISVVMTYLAQGQNGIEEYAEDRADVSMQSTGKDTDRFFLVSRDPTRPRPHPAIKKNHKSLITEANRRSSGEGSVVERVLSCVEEKVLQLEPRRRESAGYISNKLLDASAAYRKLSEDLGNPGSYTTSQTTSRNAFSRFWHGTFHRQKPDSPKIESWIVPDSKSAVGCSIAPDEFVIAHWTDTRISLYNSQSFPQYPHREMNFIAECGLKGTDSWKSVKLNESYLIASTTSHHSPVYLFDIKGGNLPGLSLDLSYDFVLPVHSSTGIHQIAVSPGGKVLACVVSRDAKRSWVLYADINNLISRQVRRYSYLMSKIK
ncbi:kinase-like protein [Hypoxylon sp. FL1857]|nr:kinase-like protein [Hypoxylon sp. FL1857]